MYWPSRTQKVSIIAESSVWECCSGHARTCLESSRLLYLPARWFPHSYHSNSQYFLTVERLTVMSPDGELKLLMHTCGEGNGTPLQYSCLENPMDGGAWWAAVHGVAKSGTWLSDFTFTFHLHAVEKEMATHSSVIAWRIPGTGEPGGLLSMGLHRVGHDWSDLAAAEAAMRTSVSAAADEGHIVQPLRF